MTENRVLAAKEVNEYYGSGATAIWEMLMGDSLHLGGTEETELMAKKGGINRDTHVLDVCCGLGGPARDLARKFGCRVTGIDVTVHHYNGCSRSKTSVTN